MNQQLLDVIARGIFQLVGLDPETVRQQQAAESRRKLNQQRTQAKGQTKTTNAKGNLRDFRSPAQSANRPPSTDPVQTRSTRQATPPKRPAGGFGQSPGQLSISQVTGGNNPSAKPGGKYQAPSVPQRMGAPTAAAGPDIPKGPDRNPFRNTKPTRPAGGFVKPTSIKPTSKLTLGKISNFLSGGILGQGTQLVDIMLNALNTSVLEETFGSGRVMEDFQRSLDRRNGKSNTTKSTPLPSYSGMADASGDALKPQRSNNNRSGGSTSSANTGGGTATRIPVQPAYNEGATAAPSRPDYSNMTELERLKIWATTNRQMIESVGTSKQRGILKQALGIKDPAPLTGRQI